MVLGGGVDNVDDDSGNKLPSVDDSLLRDFPGGKPLSKSPGEIKKNYDKTRRSR